MKLCMEASHILDLSTLMKHNESNQAIQDKLITSFNSSKSRNSTGVIQVELNLEEFKKCIVIVNQNVENSKNENEDLKEIFRQLKKSFMVG